MISDEIYELCVPFLQDKELNEEVQVEKIEEVVGEKTELTGSARDNAVLDILWRHRGSTKPGTTPPVRHTVIRRTSPAPWHLSRTPSTASRSNSSPAPPPGFPASRPSFPRAPKSSTVSPFTSPRPSPRLALAQQIPHSPSLSTYQFSEPSSRTVDNYGDLGRDNVDWLVNDDAVALINKPSAPSSVTSLSAAAPEFQPPPRMSPYDILRAVLGARRTDVEINAALEANGYDLETTMYSLTEMEGSPQISGPDSHGRILVGKSMLADQLRPLTPSNQGRSPVVCKYWSTTGQCLRADCRFSHDLTTHICKYWVKGACLAGEGCSFSHDPSAVVGNLNGSNGNSLNVPGSPGSNSSPASHPLRNSFETFPALQSPVSDQWPSPSQTKYPVQAAMHANSQYRIGSPSNGSNMRNKNGGMNSSNRLSHSNSRPTSRQQARDLSFSSLSVDDPEAFPTLSSLNSKSSRKRSNNKQGQNREGTLDKDNLHSSLNNTKMSSSPTPSPRRPASRPNNQNNRPPTMSPEKAAAALAIATPKSVPWFDPEPRGHKMYIQYRTDAIAFLNDRTKYLQTANVMWGRNDTHRARELTVQGHIHSERGHLCYRLAAQHLYELHRDYYESSESLEDDVYIDLHSLNPEEAIEYIEPILQRQDKLGRRLVYIITGTSYSKNHKDKIARAVKTWLNTYQYVFREFSMNGENKCYSAVGVLGVDPTSYETCPYEALGGGPPSVVEPTTKATTAVHMLGGRGGTPPGRLRLLKREAAGKEAEKKI